MKAVIGTACVSALVLASAALRTAGTAATVVGELLEAAAWAMAKRGGQFR